MRINRIVLKLLNIKKKRYTLDKYQALAVEVGELLADKKGLDVVVLDLRGLSGLTDYFIIATGGNARHTSALASHVEDELEEKGIFVHHKEGHREGDWVLLDYVDFVVHVFNENKRAYYDLDSAWSSAPVIARF